MEVHSLREDACACCVHFMELIFKEQRGLSVQELAEWFKSEKNVKLIENSHDVMKNCSYTCSPYAEKLNINSIGRDEYCMYCASILKITEEQFSASSLFNTELEFAEFFRKSHSIMRKHWDACKAKCYQGAIPIPLLHDAVSSEMNIKKRYFTPEFKKILDIYKISSNCWQRSELIEGGMCGGVCSEKIYDGISGYLLDRHVTKLTAFFTPQVQKCIGKVIDWVKIVTMLGKDRKHGIIFCFECVNHIYESDCQSLYVAVKDVPYIDHRYFLIHCQQIIRHVLKSCPGTTNCYHIREPKHFLVPQIIYETDKHSFHASFLYVKGYKALLAETRKDIEKRVLDSYTFCD